MYVCVCVCEFIYAVSRYIYTFMCVYVCNYKLY